MCGRYALTLPPDAVKRLFGYPETPNFPPRWNIAPTQPIPIVRGGRDGAHFLLVRWGLIPAWVKDPRDFTLLINARAETAAGKPAFRGAMKYRRCLVPASGFYEWRRDGKDKRPFLIRPRDGGVVAFAGLWETYLGADGGEIDTAAILTTAANRLMAPIHDRMPAVIPPSEFARWLDADGSKPADVADLLRPAPDDLFEAVPISTRVNAVRNDDAAVQEPLSEPLHVDAPTGEERREGGGQGELF